MQTKPTIDLKNDNFGAVLNCAVRYSLGRHTYMPGLVMDFIGPLLPYVSDRTLWCMERDIETLQANISKLREDMDSVNTETDLAAFDEAHDLERGLKHIELY